ncbi:MAG: DUF1801 domain-containing protein [Proteobacteria bacterium]|nr:MAG: DUF1801 domain-containing protein [Pseudomonadota bacterium]
MADDWRVDTLEKVRDLMTKALPDAVEELKWRGVPTWSHNGLICTGETYKATVKLTFVHGASLSDPSKLFNASLEGNTRRAIDIKEGEAINDKALKALFKEAAKFNEAKVKLKAAKPKK